MKPIPAAVAAGLAKRRARRDRARWFPRRGGNPVSARCRRWSFAERVPTLLYANRADHAAAGDLLQRTFARVLSAYDAEGAPGAAKTEQLLSHMLLSEQNAGRLARRLGRDAVASIRAKLAGLRLDSSRPIDERIAELKRRLVVSNGPTKRGRMRFLQTGEEIEVALMSEIGKAKASGWKPASPLHFIFNTYARGRRASIRRALRGSAQGRRRCRGGDRRALRSLWLQALGASVRRSRIARTTRG